MCMEKSEELREEMGKQLDLSLLLSRLIFLERSLLKFFEHGQFEAMHPSRKLTLEQARRMRQHLNLRSRLKRQTEKPSITNNDALNNTEFGAKEQSADFTKQPPQKAQESDSEDSVDSDLERHAKEAIKMFKNSLEQGNKRSIQVSKQLQSNILSNLSLTEQKDIYQQFKRPSENFSQIQKYHSFGDNTMPLKIKISPKILTVSQNNSTEQQFQCIGL